MWLKFGYIGYICVAQRINSFQIEQPAISSHILSQCITNLSHNLSKTQTQLITISSSQRSHFWKSPKPQSFILIQLYTSMYTTTYQKYVYNIARKSTPTESSTNCYKEPLVLWRLEKQFIHIVWNLGLHQKRD
jgi:hypothetical protein